MKNVEVQILPRPTKAGCWNSRQPCTKVCGFFEINLRLFSQFKHLLHTVYQADSIEEMGDAGSNPAWAAIWPGSVAVTRPL